MITKWQYKVVRLGGPSTKTLVADQELLNSLGDEGWDLVSVNDYGYDWVVTPRAVAYLKKEVTRAESGPP